MKGQAQILGAASVVVVVVSMTLIGLLVYGLISNVYPHDQLINNETRCTTCDNETLYRFTNTPILNDSTLICFNDSADLMTNGVVEQTCLGYNIVGLKDLNITNTSSTDFCQISNVVCTYTFDEANTNEQSFYNNNTDITFSGFTLLSIAGIILAAVAIVLLVLLLKG